MTASTSTDSERRSRPSPRRRVLLFDHTARLSGGEIALANLVTHLDHTRYEVIVLLGAKGPLLERLKSSGIEVRVMPLASGVSETRKDSLGVLSLLRVLDILRALLYVFRMAIFIVRRRVDIVHTNSLKSDIIGGLAGRMTLRPVIWHIRDRITDDYLPPAVARLFRKLCTVIPHYVVANSYSTLSTLTLPGSIRVGKPGENTRGGSHSEGLVVHSGVPVELYPDSSRQGESDETPRGDRSRAVHDGIATQQFEQASAGSGRQQQVVGLIGRISPWKGQHIFIQAALEVHRRHPGARFRIIGSPLFGETQYEAEIQKLTRDLGLEDCVEFTGFRENIAKEICDLDMVVHASTTGEPFGQVVAEGMAAGKPVVATNGGGVPEFVEDGVTGLLVPMGDAAALANGIDSLLSDPERMERMGSLGRYRIEKHFTIDITARRIEAIYEEILRRRRSALS